MTNTRKKLVKLLNDHTCLEDKDDCAEECAACLADHLIAHGVTVQECKVVDFDNVAKDINVPDKNVVEWISVKDRLPEPMEWVLCACRAKIIEVLRYDNIMDDWDTTMPNRAYMKGFVTHWMPLPQPPKGE